MKKFFQGNNVSSDVVNHVIVNQARTASQKEHCIDLNQVHLTTAPEKAQTYQGQKL